LSTLAFLFVPFLGLAVATTGGHAQGTTAGWRTFVDPQGRFEFSYPESFGEPVRGTDSGFQNRTAAYRFPALVGLGGEAALTSGFIDVDIQALGGLYDSIARGVLQDADVPTLVAALPRLTPTNFCSMLGATDRVQGLKLAPRLLTAAKMLDVVRNVSPVVRRCTVTDRVAVFHKETTFESGTMSARQHLFGALRFLDAPYSSFQLVRGAATAPSAADLDVLERVVRSFVIRQ
jgi:hypothetical protein